MTPNKLDERTLPAMPEPAMKSNPGVCCGNFTTGGSYMGQTEELCCGQLDEAWPDYFTAEQMTAYAIAAREPLMAEVERLKLVNDGMKGIAAEQGSMILDALDRVATHEAEIERLRAMSDELAFYRENGYPYIDHANGRKSFNNHFGDEEIDESDAGYYAMTLPAYRPHPSSEGTVMAITIHGYTVADLYTKAKWHIEKIDAALSQGERES